MVGNVARPGSLPAEPVLVAGAGPVGQTAALLLARWGLPVVVVDARPERDLVGSKALVQQRDVIDVWCAVGAGDQIAAEGVTWTTGRTMFRDRELFVTRWVDSGASPLPAFVNISQSRTEELLDEQIAGNPLVDVRWGHEVVDIRQDGAGVTLVCRTADGETAVRGSHAVACGGARGDALRRALGVRFDGESFTDPFLICDIRTDLGDWASERRFYFDPEWNPGRQVLVHPSPGSTARIDWQVAPGYDLDAEEVTGALDRRIRMIVGERDYEIVWKSVYRFHSRCTDRFRAGRVLLAGDLAHLVSPFGARGLNSGVQDAENAAWKIAFVRHGWGDEETLLEELPRRAPGGGTGEPRGHHGDDGLPRPRRRGGRRTPAERPRAGAPRSGGARSRGLGPAGGAVLVRGVSARHPGPDPARTEPAAEGRVPGAGTGRPRAGLPVRRRGPTGGRPVPSSSSGTGSSPSRPGARPRSTRRGPGWSRYRPRSPSATSTSSAVTGSPGGASASGTARPGSSGPTGTSRP